MIKSMDNTKVLNLQYMSNKEREMQQRTFHLQISIKQRTKRHDTAKIVAFVLLFCNKERMLIKTDGFWAKTLCGRIIVTEERRKKMEGRNNTF